MKALEEAESKAASEMEILKRKLKVAEEEKIVAQQKVLYGASEKGILMCFYHSAIVQGIDNLTIP